MKNERLLLPVGSDDQFIERVIGALCLSDGVAAASRVPDSVEVSVQFDEQVTSADVLRATLKLAGYNIAPAKAGGGCCGACGG